MTLTWETQIPFTPNSVFQGGSSFMSFVTVTDKEGHKITFQVPWWVTATGGGGFSLCYMLQILYIMWSTPCGPVHCVDCSMKGGSLSDTKWKGH